MLFAPLSVTVEFYGASRGLPARLPASASPSARMAVTRSVCLGRGTFFRLLRASDSAQLVTVLALWLLWAPQETRVSRVRSHTGCASGACVCVRASAYRVCDVPGVGSPPVSERRVSLAGVNPVLQGACDSHHRGCNGCLHPDGCFIFTERAARRAVHRSLCTVQTHCAGGYTQGSRGGVRQRRGQAAAGG